MQTMQTILNTSAATPPPQPPRKENGNLYEYEAIIDNGKRRVYYDKPAELLNLLIEGYKNADNENRNQLRQQHAQKVRDIQQTLTLVEYDNRFTLNEKENYIVNNVNTVGNIRWGNETPLILVETQYQPYTNRKRPYSILEDVQHPRNLWWIQPQTEHKYLRSLQKIGYLKIYCRTE